MTMPCVSSGVQSVYVGTHQNTLCILHKATIHGNYSKLPNCPTIRRCQVIMHHTHLAYPTKCGLSNHKWPIQPHYSRPCLNLPPHVTPCLCHNWLKICAHLIVSLTLSHTTTKPHHTAAHTLSQTHISPGHTLSL